MELQLRKQAAEELISQRLRAALHQTGADFAAIRLSSDATKAAKENLALVADAYSRGAAPIVQLLDAQNQALVAEFSAANSVYRFIASLMDVERGVGSFNMFTSSKRRGKLLMRLEEYERQRSSEFDRRRENTSNP
jgi:outer membrane protein TolC